MLLSYELSYWTLYTQKCCKITFDACRLVYENYENSKIKEWAKS